MNLILSISATVLVFAAQVHSAAVIGTDSDNAACTGIAHCDTCLNPGLECEYCTGNTILSKDYKECLTCPDYCEKCTESPVGQTQCTTCATGYYQTKDKDCDSCPGYCDKCSNHTSCQKCKNGYFKTSSFVKCLTCPENCEECSYSNWCLRCANGFFLDLSGYCQQCPGGWDCWRCSDYSRCEECASRTYWDETMLDCRNCISDCDKCSSSDTCDSCISGYFLSADKTRCIGASYCTAYEDTTGCSACMAGYSVDDSLTCSQCGDANTISTCGNCPLEGRGRWWEAGNSKCGYCLPNCLSCSSGTTCDSCVQGMVFDSPSGSCVSCAIGTLDSPNSCTQCTGKYFDYSVDTCNDCPTGGVVSLTDSYSCTACPSAATGYYWASGQCTAVQCSGTGLSEEECNVCPAKIWNGGTSYCDALDCSVLPPTQAECEKCSEKRWKIGECIDGACLGAMDDKKKCEICDHYWNNAGANCQAVDCSSASLSEDACFACADKYWDGSVCQDINCAVDELATQQQCDGCWMEFRYWDPATSVCATSDCLGIPATEAECIACYMSWESGTCNALACSGSFDTKAECLACDGRYWDDGASVCTAVLCGVLTDQTSCEACDLNWWDASASPGLECTSVADCSVVTTEPECNACQVQGYYWDTASSSCLSVDCQLPLPTEDQCLACPIKFWQQATCLDVDCSDPSVLADVSCDECSGLYWDVASSSCLTVDCTSTLDIQDKCEDCAGRYWDVSSSSCKVLPDCTTAIIHNQFVCEGCGDPAAGVPNRWDTTNGQCWVCPTNCKSCNPETGGCSSCQEGWTLDINTYTCHDCATATNLDDDPEICEQCSGRYYSGNKCKTCMANCASCNNANSCDLCNPGFVTGVGNTKCLDCVMETSTECKSCGSSSRANYFTPDGLCNECGMGCIECSDPGDTCIKCAANYFLDPATSTCETCSGAILDTADKCEICMGEGYYFASATSSCTPCDPGCEKCISSDQCDRCSYAKYFDSANAGCKNCPANCVECTDSSSCQNCQSNMWFDPALGYCTSCPSNCASCDTAGCTLCNTNYNLKGNTCIRCADMNCDVCSDETTCDICKNNYCYDKDNKACYSSPYNCATCKMDTNGDISCLTCKDTYFLEVCKACSVTYCTDCEADDTKCEQCADGFYYDESANQCKTCGTGCESCKEGSSGDVVCDECISAYFLDLGSCTACGSYCATCDASGCKECISDNYYKDGEDCQRCSSDCISCSNSDSCATCSAGFYITDGACAKCPANCKTCTGNSDGTLSCTECHQGFYQGASECISCSAEFTNCGKCSSATTCEECVYGYTLSDDNTKCLECNIDSCGQCVDPPTFCEICSTGYVRSEDELSCHPGCYSCHGDHCLATTTTNDTTEACPGLTEDDVNACWTYRIENEEGKVSHGRTCLSKNETCTADKKEEECKTVTKEGKDVKMCARCCTTHLCNKDELTGVGNSAAGITTVNILVPGMTLMLITILINRKS